MILSITYGIEATSWDDPYVTKIEHMLALGGDAGLPGAWLVDSLPFRTWIRVSSFCGQINLCYSQICAGVGSRCRIQTTGQGMEEACYRNIGCTFPVRQEQRGKYTVFGSNP